MRVLRLRTRSAVYIDYENVAAFLSPDDIENLIQWIEDGGFDGGRKRKLVDKKLYCNIEAQRHEEVFRSHGFEVVRCAKVVPLKNGADIRMCIDVVERLCRKRAPKEIILLTRDSDFIPLVDFAKGMRKVTVILADEQNERLFELFSKHANIAISVRTLRAATAYERQVRLRDFREALARFKARFRALQLRRPAEPAVPDAVMQAAIAIVLDVTSRKPNQHTARRDIERALRKIEGFTAHGEDKYFGLGSYNALIREIARHTDRVVVDEAHGVAARYVPEPEAS
jgi:hypothetical protein